MPGDDCLVRPLFGGAITSCFPSRFQDVSNIREVPGHQEVFADPSRDESLIFELLDLKHEVGDNGSAVWFLRDIANEQDAAETMVLEHSGTLEAVGLSCGGGPTIVTTAVGQMVIMYRAGSLFASDITWQAISKERQGREAQNLVRVYLANLRLKEVSTDVLITAYEPILINPLSESARTVGAGPAVPAAQSGCLPVAEVFKLAVTNFKGIQLKGRNYSQVWSPVLAGRLLTIGANSPCTSPQLMVVVANDDQITQADKNIARMSL